MRQILLVDDDAMQLRLRETVLRSAGFPVDVATSAESALALLHSEPLASGIGLVVTDHVLHGVSGAEFVRALRRFNADVPVLVVTGMIEAEDEYQGLNVTFRRKPCPPPDLVSAARSLFQVQKRVA